MFLMLPKHLRVIFPNGIFLEFCSLAHISLCCFFPRICSSLPGCHSNRGGLVTVPSSSCPVTKAGPTTRGYTGPGAEASVCRCRAGCLVGPGDGRRPVGPSPQHTVWRARSPLFPHSSEPCPPLRLCPGRPSHALWPKAWHCGGHMYRAHLRVTLPGLCAFVLLEPRSWPRSEEGKGCEGQAVGSAHVLLGHCPG